MNWRDLPADGRKLDALIAERVFGIHVHDYERGSGNVYLCSREGCTHWAGGPAPSSDVNGYSTEPQSTAKVLRWFEEQGWSWEVSYRWGLGYRASATKQHESPFKFTNVDDCPSWLVAVCRLALDIVDGAWVDR